MTKKLQTFLSRSKSTLTQAGFTMIELLIVIAILGILAVAVLSAINPVEQINRGRDTGSRSDAEQLLSGIDRYNAFQGYYPWMVGAGDTNIAVSWTQVTDSWADSGGTCPIYEKLSQASTTGCTGTDELKITYFNRVLDSTYNPLFVYNRGQQGDATYVCFAPRSAAFVTEAAARVDATLPSDFPPSGSAYNNTTDCGPNGDCVCLP